MNLDSLFTVAALFAAVYAILSSAERMRISFYLGRIGVTITCLSFLIIICLHYYHILCMSDMSPPKFNVLGYILTPYDASFAVFLIAAIMIILIYLMRRKIMLPYKIVKFHELILQLYDDEKYPEILLLVYDNLNWIKKVSEKEFWLFKIHGCFAPEVQEINLELLYNIKNENNNTNISIKERINSWLSKVFPSGEKEAGVASQIIDMIHTDKNLIKVMAFNRHELAISILDQKLGNSKELANIYLCYLIKDKKSILYSEIWDESNRKILIFLFGDCNKAMYLNVWEPIGECVIEELNELYRQKDRSPDVYNDSTELYERDVGKRFRRESPLFTGVLFFDKMVDSALKQNIEHHMWLLYFRYFVDRILRNLWPEKDVNMEYEFPTHYHGLLYEIVSSLLCWINVVRTIPLSQENIKIDSEHPPYMENNIMQLTLVILGEVVYQIVTCDEDKIGKKFKFDIIQMVYNCYFGLMKNDGTKIYARALINSVRRGRMTWEYEVKSTSLQYKEILLDVAIANNNKIVDLTINPEVFSGLCKILQDDIDNHDESNCIY